MKDGRKFSRVIVGLAAVVILLVAGGGLATGKPVVVKSLHDQLLGYWAPDKEAMIEMFKKEMARGGQENPQQLAQALEMAEMMAVSFVAHFSRDTATIYGGPGEPEKSTYKVKSSDNDTGTITVEISSNKGKTQEGKAVIKGDKMVLVSGKQEMHMNRITEAKFKIITEKLKEANRPEKGANAAVKPKK